MFASFFTTIRTRARVKSRVDVGKHPEYIIIMPILVLNNCCFSVPNSSPLLWWLRE